MFLLLLCLMSCFKLSNLPQLIGNIAGIDTTEFDSLKTEFEGFADYVNGGGSTDDTRFSDLESDSAELRIIKAFFRSANYSSSSSEGLFQAFAVTLPGSSTAVTKSLINLAFDHPVLLILILDQVLESAGKLPNIGKKSFLPDAIEANDKRAADIIVDYYKDVKGINIHELYNMPGVNTSATANRAMSKNSEMIKHLESKYQL